MTEACPKCGRPRWPAGALSTPDMVHCWHEGGRECDGYAAGYRRGRRDGIDEGVQIAKERHIIDSTEVNWVGVEAEAEQAKERT